MKKAFTLIELVFVVVVIGIIAAVIIPRTNSDRVGESVIELISKIKYAQHLAMVDDKFDANDANWYRKRWQIEFSDPNKYSIMNNGLFAKNTMDNTDIDDVELTKMTVTLSGGCGDKKIISFDHLGRPIIGDISALTSAYAAGTNTAPYNDGQLLASTCVITVTDSSITMTINLEPETGYIHRGD